MKRRNNNSDFIKVAYSETRTYRRTGHISEYGEWMTEEESTSYYESYCAEIYRDVNRRASSMRV